MIFNQSSSSSYSVKPVFTHITLSLLAAGIAFSMPDAAQNVLHQWWPEGNSGLLLVMQVMIAAVLVLLFNIFKIAWDNSRRLKANALASLVHAGESGDRLSWRNHQKMLKGMQQSGEISILSVTGNEMLGKDHCWIRQVLDESNEIRVLLMNPEGQGAYERTRLSTNPEAVREGYRQEIAASIACLETLRNEGKRVSLKFYDAVPFWKMVVAGDYVQVQYCYGTVVSEWPEYIFALRKDKPRRGLFTPFYVNFLNQWQDRLLPEYDFETQQLVYRDNGGKEIGREPLYADMANPAGNILDYYRPVAKVVNG